MTSPHHPAAGLAPPRPGPPRPAPPRPAPPRPAPPVRGRRPAERAERADWRSAPRCAAPPRPELVIALDEDEDEDGGGGGDEEEEEEGAACAAAPWPDAIPAFVFAPPLGFEWLAAPAHGTGEPACVDEPACTRFADALAASLEGAARTEAPPAPAPAPAPAVYDWGVVRLPLAARCALERHAAVLCAYCLGGANLELDASGRVARVFCASCRVILSGAPENACPRRGPACERRRWVDALGAPAPLCRACDARRGRSRGARRGDTLGARLAALSLA